MPLWTVVLDSQRLLKLLSRILLSSFNIVAGSIFFSYWFWAKVRYIKIIPFDIIWAEADEHHFNMWRRPGNLESTNYSLHFLTNLVEEKRFMIEKHIISVFFKIKISTTYSLQLSTECQRLSKIQTQFLDHPCFQYRMYSSTWNRMNVTLFLSKFGKMTRQASIFSFSEWTPRAKLFPNKQHTYITIFYWNAQCGVFYNVGRCVTEWDDKVCSSAMQWIRRQLNMNDNRERLTCYKRRRNCIYCELICNYQCLLPIKFDR